MGKIDLTINKTGLQHNIEGKQRYHPDHRADAAS